MTNNIPGWNFESDTCVTNQKNPIGPGQELVELLWQNGQVVFNSQTQRKQIGNSSGMGQDQKNDQSTLKTSGLYGNSSNLSQEDDDTVSWLQYPLEDPLEQQFCSNFLSEIVPYEIESYKPIKQLVEGNFAKFAASSAPQPHATSSSQSPDMKPSCVQEFQGNPMPVPRFHVPDSSKQAIDFGRSKKVPKFSHFSTPPNVSSVSANAQVRKNVTANIPQSEARECSVMTVGSSHCGSNHIPLEPDVSMVSSSGGWTTTLSAETETARDYVQRTIPWSEKGKSEMAEPNLTSSSGGSGSSLGKTCSLSTGNLGQKRKRTDAEELEEQSEATELKSGIGSKASQRAGYSRRNRAAEVHNLSERRRRDRINEKMRALQELIPNSNKTDKASMLEEAIEYLKSLQLQLQVMWMGAGMSPMMFPGRQHYMSQMPMGMAAPSLPSIQNPMQLPRVPLDQSMPLPQTPNQTNVMCQNPVLDAFIYQNQMQNSFLAEQYARYMGYYLTQSATQPVNAYRYGSQAVQNSQTMIAPGSSSAAMSGASNMNDAMNANMGKPLNTFW